MNTFKKLFNEIRNNNLDTLIEKYRTPYYIINEQKNSYEWREKSVQLFHIVDDTYSLELFYENTIGEKKQLYKKSVVFSKDKNGKNYIDSIELINNHSFWEGMKRSVHTNYFTNKVCLNIDNLWKANY